MEKTDCLRAFYSVFGCIDWRGWQVMFLKKSRLKPYNLKRFKKTITNEGVAKEGYTDEVEEVRLELWPATSKLQSEIYGDRINDILNANASKDADINVKDGVCIDSKTDVTHRVVSKKVYSKHQVLELERVRFARSR
nr:MAG TPA: head closure knob [Caudoviricetes sp.]